MGMGNFNEVTFTCWSKPLFSVLFTVILMTSSGKEFQMCGPSY